MKKYPQVRRVRRPEYNEKAPFLVGVWQFIMGTFLWILFIVIAGITIYSQWFSNALVSILRLFKNQNYYIPGWFSMIATIFFFPVTLVVILISALVTIFRGK